MEEDQTASQQPQGPDQDGKRKADDRSQGPGELRGADNYLTGLLAALSACQDILARATARRCVS